MSDGCQNYDKGQEPPRSLKRSEGSLERAGSAATDVIKSTLPPKENRELARELLGRFPGVDRAELLEDMVALCFYQMRWGNKREERSACDFLNDIQKLAIRRAGKTPNGGTQRGRDENAPPATETQSRPSLK